MFHLEIGFSKEFIEAFQVNNWPHFAVLFGPNKNF